MSGILTFGIFVGIIAAGLNKQLTTRKVFGWIIIASIGALEGKILGSLLHEYTNPAANLTPLFTVMGSMLLISLKLLTGPIGQTPRTGTV